MLDRRRWARHGRACAFLFVVAFLALSLVGYDPADPPGLAAEPPNDPPANPCGPVGATLAHLLFAMVGRASFLLLFASAVADLLAFRRRKVADPTLRLIGLGLIVAVASALLQKFDPGRRPAPPVGSGGYVGAASVAFLEGQFGQAGMLLILGALGLIGLALCHDILIVWPLQEFFGLFRRPDPASAAPIPIREGAELMLEAPREFSQPLPRLAPPPVNRPVASRPSPSLEGPGSIPSRPMVPPPPRSVPATPLDGSFQLPPLDLLEPAAAVPIQEHQAKVHARAMLLEKTLLEFGCQVRVVQIDTGPVITQFEIELEAGLRVAKINSVANDLAIALAVQSVRIVSPIPNKTTVGIEVPNERRTMVRLSEVIGGVGAAPGQVPDSPVPRPGREGEPARLRPGRHAPPPDRRPDRHRQVGLPERDDPLDPDDPNARRGQADPDRPQDRRADPVQAHPAPDEPGRHRHEEGRGPAGLGLRQDGRTIRLSRPRRGPEHRGDTIS